jgi:hypothetical protein
MLQFKTPIPWGFNKHTSKMHSAVYQSIIMPHSKQQIPTASAMTQTQHI